MFEFFVTAQRVEKCIDPDEHCDFYIFQGLNHGREIPRIGNQYVVAAVEE